MTQQQGHISSRALTFPKPPRPPAFIVTAAGDKVTLDESGRGRAPFMVTNASAQPLKGRLVARPRKPAKPEWLSIVGESIRDFAPNAAEQVVVQLDVPPGSKPGSYKFRLDAVSEDDPDEVFTEGPFVAFDVAPPPEPKKRFPWWILAVVGAAVLLAVIGVLTWLLLRGDDTGAVPAVTSMSASVANSTLTGAGFTVRTSFQPVSDPTKNGDVQSQDPAAGSSQEPGTPVTITVGQMSLVPSVLGRVEATARTMLADADLGVAVRFVGRDVPVEDPPRDLKVLAQDPAGNTLQRPGTVVTLTLGPNVPVPDVRGMDLLHAEAFLWVAGIPDAEQLPAEAGLRARLAWVRTPNDQVGVVQSLSPAPNTRLPHGSDVEIRVGSGDSIANRLRTGVPGLADARPGSN
jgi:beta-lactam-binding protein with PASTA domain